MTYPIALLAPARIRWPELSLLPVRTHLSVRNRSDRMLRAGTAAVITATLLTITVGVSRIVYQQPGDAWIAVAATCAYLPLHLSHIHHASLGRRPPHSWWTLTLMAGIILAGLPVIGMHWLGALYPLGASVLVVVRPRWSIVLFGGLIVLAGVGAILLGDRHWGIYFSAGVLLNGLVLAVPVWLVAAVRELQAVRAQLAFEAVVAERARVEEELARTLGVAMQAVAAEGVLAARHIDTAPELAAANLRTVVDTARRALADGRSLTAGFRETGLQGELKSAAALLRAAGVEVHYVPTARRHSVLPTGTLIAGLRAEVSRLLQEDGISHCTIGILDHDGGISVEIRSAGEGIASRRVIAA